MQYLKIQTKYWLPLAIQRLFNITPYSYFSPKPDPSNFPNLFRRCVGDCQNQAHGQCAKYQSARHSKTLRILDIINTSLLLCKLPQKLWKCTFITLSHLWMTPAPPKLGRENADKLHRRHPLGIFAPNSPGICRDWWLAGGEIPVDRPAARLSGLGSRPEAGGQHYGRHIRRSSDQHGRDRRRRRWRVG